MMLSNIGSCSVFVLLLSFAAAAPIEKAPDAKQNVNEVQKQEEELQSLLRLADEKSARSDVTVHEEHKQHVHEVNGHKMEVDTARKTVSDTETGQVFSDVKQEVSKAEGSAGADQPEVEVKTEVDVPEEGVHETIVQSGSEAEEPTEEEMEQAEAEEMEFSPEAVAAYLYRTGNFKRFYTALAQLVNASIMTEEDAQEYSELVAKEYQRMEFEDYENSILVQRRVPPVLEEYPVAMETPNMYPLPMDAPAPQEAYPVGMETPDSLFGYDPEPSSVKDVDFDPYELLYALWNEAYGSGDARAEALVSELFDKVRGDNDLDDEGQVRDILLDLIANSLTEDDMPSQETLYGWQPITDADASPIQPMANAVPPQPMAELEDEEAANELMAETQKRAAEQPTLSKETNAAGEQQQPMGESDTEAQEQEESSETKEEMNQQEQQQEQQQQEKSNAGQEQAAASAPISAKKRAAETV